jgi:hypothetical protein
MVGMVIQLANGGFHALAKFRSNGPRSNQHVGDGSDRDLSVSGYLFNGRDVRPPFVPLLSVLPETGAAATFL